MSRTSDCSVRSEASSPPTSLQAPADDGEPAELVDDPRHGLPPGREGGAELFEHLVEPLRVDLVRVERPQGTRRTSAGFRLGLRQGGRGERRERPLGPVEPTAYRPTDRGETLVGVERRVGVARFAQALSRERPLGQRPRSSDAIVRAPANVLRSSRPIAASSFPRAASSCVRRLNSSNARRLPGGMRPRPSFRFTISVTDRGAPAARLGAGRRDRAFGSRVRPARIRLRAAYGWRRAEPTPRRRHRRPPGPRT